MKIPTKKLFLIPALLLLANQAHAFTSYYYEVCNFEQPMNRVRRIERQLETNLVLVKGENQDYIGIYDNKIGAPRE